MRTKARGRMIAAAHHRRGGVVGLVLIALAGCASPVHQGAAGPRFSDTGPDAEEHGAREGYRKAVIYRPRFFVGSFSHPDELLDSRAIRRAATPSRLGRAPEPPLQYEYQGQRRTLDQYLARNPTTGLIIARGAPMIWDTVTRSKGRDLAVVSQFDLARLDAQPADRGILRVWPSVRSAPATPTSSPS